MNDEIVQEVKESKDWKVKLQNFQSIVNGEITIQAGLNLVTGDTNQGKTAFIRAIECAMWNTGTDDMVKAGTKIAGVTISNGRHEMVYCRNSQGKNEKTAYQFDGGTVQRKVGRTQLPEVVSMFGIRDVRMQNGIKMKLNFWLQNEKPFLTDKTSGQLYEFLSLSSCDKYVKVLKQMVVDIKVHEAEINNANIKIDTLKTINNRKQEFIDENKGFDDIYERTIVASSESKIFNQNVDNLNDIQTLSGGINNAKDKLIGINDKLAKIDIQGVLGRYDKLIELSDLYSNIYNIMTDLKRIKDSIKDTKSKVEEVSDSYDKLSKDEKSLGDKVKILDDETLKYLNTFTEAFSCERAQTKIDDIKNRIISLESKTIDTDSLRLKIDTLSEESENFSLCESIILSLKGIKESIRTSNDNIKTSLEKIKDSEDELETLKSEVGYCPFCGSVFEGKHEH